MWDPGIVSTLLSGTWLQLCILAAGVLFPLVHRHAVHVSRGCVEHRRSLTATVVTLSALDCAEGIRGGDCVFVFGGGLTGAQVVGRPEYKVWAGRTPHVHRCKTRRVLYGR